MPQAVALAAAAAASNALAAAGATVATQAIVASAVATATAFAVTTAISVAISIAANAILNPRPPRPKPSDGQLEFQQAVPPRMFHYGRVAVAGPLAFLESTAPGGKVAKIILLSAREIDAVEESLLDERHLTIDGTGLVTNTFNEESASARVFIYTGTDTQTADAHLITNFPTLWTSAHRLRGIAYAVTSFEDANPEYHQRAFPNGVPNYKAILRGNKLYDPRLDSTVTGGSGAHRHATKSTWEWSDNAALAILDWLTHDDGYRIPITKIDLAGFMNMADLCDELVDLKAGGTEKRYRIATTVYLTEARKDVLARLLEACDGRLYANRNGTWGIRGGQWVAPTVSLDADAGHIIDAEFSDGMPALNRYNEISFRYLSPAHGYTEVEGDPWIDTDLLADMGGVVETRSRDLTHIPSHGQARRLLKIGIAKDNPRWVGEIRTNFAGLDAIGEEITTLSWSELDVPPGNFNGPFWIDGDMTFLSDGTGASLRVRSATAASYDWDEDAEEGTEPPVPPENEDDNAG